MAKKSLMGLWYRIIFVLPNYLRIKKLNDNGSIDLIKNWRKYWNTHPDSAIYNLKIVKTLQLTPGHFRNCTDMEHWIVAISEFLFKFFACSVLYICVHWVACISCYNWPYNDPRFYLILLFLSFLRFSVYQQVYVYSLGSDFVIKALNVDVFPYRDRCSQFCCLFDKTILQYWLACKLHLPLIRSHLPTVYEKSIILRQSDTTYALLDIHLIPIYCIQLHCRSIGSH